MIGIINYGSGNICAIENIYKRLGAPYFLSADPSALRNANRYILPGVGAFDSTMTKLHDLGLVDMLNDEVFLKRKPFLGICVGMQILASSSDEGIQQGLGWISGRVRKINTDIIPTQLKLPHMGWNSLAVCEPRHPLLNGIDLKIGFYFLHSFFLDAEQNHDVHATVEYGSPLPCFVARDNVMGVQFHPEKSHHNGINLFRNFAAL